MSVACAWSSEQASSARTSAVHGEARLVDLPRAEIVLKETAREEKREFEPEALTKLVHDLSLVKVQQADGSYREEPGGVVEPMQLQVAGCRLWEKTKEKIKPFRVEDVEAGGGVSEARWAGTTRCGWKNWRGGRLMKRRGPWGRKPCCCMQRRSRRRTRNREQARVKG